MASYSFWVKREGDAELRWAVRYQPKTKPFGHQARATRRAIMQKNLAFLMDPGTGKTKAALDGIAMLALAGRVRRVAVFCPIFAIGVWEDEIHDHYPYNCTFETTEEFWRIEEPRCSLHYPEVKFFFMNYDKASQRRRLRQGGSYTYHYLRQIERFNPDLIVLDESHRTKKSSSNRSQALWRMTQRLRDTHRSGRPWVWLLTGTPNPKGYLDLFAQYRIMDPSIFGTNKGDFEEQYLRYGVGRNRFKVMGYKNKPALLKRIKSHAIIVPENKADLPPRIFQRIPVPLPAKIKEAYEELAEDLATEIEGQVITAANTGARRIRLLQLTGGFSTEGQQYHDAKLRATADLCHDLYEQNENMVVYARFLAEVAALEQTLSKVGYSVTAITGATPAAVRTEARREFQSLANTHPRALVFQVETGSLAITLTAASQVLFYSLPDAWDTYYQCYKRVHRTGQTQRVLIRHLICPGTVEVSQLRSLRTKADGHAELMRSPRAYLFGL